MRDARDIVFGRHASKRGFRRHGGKHAFHARPALGMSRGHPSQQRRGRDGTGGQRVDARPVTAKVQRRRAHHADDGMFRRRVEDLTCMGAEAVDRGHHDHRAMVRPCQCICKAADRGSDAPDIHTHDTAPFVGIQRAHSPPRRNDAGVRHYDVDGTDLACQCRQPVHGIGRCDIAGETFLTVRHLRQRPLQIDDRDRRAGCGQTRGNGTAQTRGSTGHHGPTSGEVLRNSHVA